jgi:hypothetical protein
MHSSYYTPELQCCWDKKCWEQKISTYGKWKLNICSTFIFLSYMIGIVHTPEQEANVLHMQRTEMRMFKLVETHVCLCVTWLLKLSNLHKN